MNDWQVVFEDRPPIHALICFFCPPFGCLTTPRLVSLEDAAMYLDYGFTIMVDPQDEADLVRYEQWQRAARPTRS